jgi:hypothetical protein
MHSGSESVLTRQESERGRGGTSLSEAEAEEAEEGGEVDRERQRR